MTTFDFLHHENPPTLAGVEPATLGADVQRKTNYAPSWLLHIWIPSHVNIFENEQADRLAKEGCNASPPISSTLTYSEHQSRVNLEILKNWRTLPNHHCCQVIYSQFGLAIHQNDHQARRRSVVPDFHKRILFSDEAHFCFNGYINKQNCHIWSEANPQVYVETPLHPEKLTVWCALWAVGIIGPYIFKNDEGHNVTVTADLYRAMITNFLISESNNHDVQELWFQQDGATCHTARATIDLLKDTF
ncbi:transposase [Trichonephila clavipes]|nr:transposase [Trichonephila clavipes]